MNDDEFGWRELIRDKELFLGDMLRFDSWDEIHPESDGRTNHHVSLIHLHHAIARNFADYIRIVMRREFMTFKKTGRRAVFSLIALLKTRNQTACSSWVERDRTLNFDEANFTDRVKLPEKPITMTDLFENSTEVIYSCKMFDIPTELRIMMSEESCQTIL